MTIFKQKKKKTGETNLGPDLTNATRTVKKIGETFEHLNR